jgi:peptidoglycan-associated lipoprotein
MRKPTLSFSTCSKKRKEFDHPDVTRDSRNRVWDGEELIQMGMLMSTQTETGNGMKRRIASILLAISLAFLAGCASTPEPAPPIDDGLDSEFSDGPAEVVPDTTVRNVVSDRDFAIAPVYFALDRSDITSQYAAGLEAAAQTVRSSGATIVIEGHCDERGSEEYNVALGERRATAVRRYLYNLGVPMGQMSTVSYGEAQPAVSGSGETAWQLNRRAEFQVR